MTTIFVVVLIMAISLSAFLLLVLRTHVRKQDKRDKKTIDHHTATQSHKRKGPIRTPHAGRVHPA